MNYLNHLSRFLFVAGIGMFAAGGLAQTASAANPYKIVNTAQTMGAGGIDYVYADNDARRLYVPRGNQVLVFDLDTLKSAGSITNARARGAAVDPQVTPRLLQQQPRRHVGFQNARNHQDH